MHITFHRANLEIPLIQFIISTARLYLCNSFDMCSKISSVSLIRTQSRWTWLFDFEAYSWVFLRWNIPLLSSFDPRHTQSNDSPMIIKEKGRREGEWKGSTAPWLDEGEEWRWLFFSPCCPLASFHFNLLSTKLLRITIMQFISSSSFAQK